MNRIFIDTSAWFAIIDGLSFTDCTSIVLMRRLHIDTVLTLDDDFRRQGFTMIPR